MQKTLAEEIYYCTHCGAANKKSAVECCECEKKITSKYRPFYDFLKKHTKEETSGVAVDTVFGIVRRFLLSHIYGILLSVTIVVAGVSMVYGSVSHIKEVTKAPVANVSTTNAAEEKPKITFEVSEDDKNALKHLATSCDSFADRLRDVEEMYWEECDYGTPDEMYARTNIPNFGYDGAHDMISNPLPIRWLDYDEYYLDMYNSFHQDRDIENILTGEECTADLALKLCADGYKVAQADYVMKSGVGMRGEANHKTWEGITTIQKLVYRFVFVEHEGTWYIVEDRLIERQGL
jgi:hypothetical protein